MIAAFLQNMSPWEWLVVLLVVLLLFGAKRLPDLARSVGKSISEFKKGVEEGRKAEKGPEKTQTPDSASAKSDATGKESGEQQS